MFVITTGPNLTEGPVYTWGGGGENSFTVTGTIQDGQGNVVADGTLLAGAFDTPVFGIVQNDILQVSGTGGDQKLQGLVDFFFDVSPPSFIFASTNISGMAFAENSEANGAFSIGVVEADITNQAVPEPGTLLLLGSGLAGAGVLRRRLFRK